MDPFSASGAGALALGANVGSGILGAFGADAEGKANAAAYRYKAGLAMMNAKINKQNASWSREAGGVNAMESGLKSGQDIAGTKVRQAGSGFDVNTGSSAAVRESQGKAAAFDQDMIRYDASKTAYGYEVKAAADEAEAKMMESAAEGAEKAGKLKMFSSILGSASSVAGKWSQFSSLSGNSGGSIGLFDNGWGAPPTFRY